MPEQNSRLHQLLKLYSANACSRDELAELAMLVNQTGDAELQAQLDSLFEQLPAGALPEGYDLDELYRIVVPAHRVRMRWFRYVAAASVLLLFGIGGYLLFSPKKSAIRPQASVVMQDVPAPQTNRATITLANGQKIFLDSAGNGTLATQNNISIVKTADGKLVYEGPKNSSPLGGVYPDASGAGSEVYNTLSNPRGSKVITMTLSDGSRVWLNAGSSVTYPVTFTGKERKVELTGEGYFEVAHDATKPFYVSAGEMEVRVLGTHFNINAYKDERSIKITLLQGSIKVSTDKTSIMLVPGEQAKLQTTNQILQKIQNVDLNQVVAWKNGLFQFNDEQIETILRQISRWYNIDIECASDKRELRFNGVISRRSNVKAIMDLLSATGVINFKMENRKLIAY